MKKLKDMTLEDRVHNIENLIYSTFMMIGVLLLLLLQIFAFKNRIILITIILAVILGFLFGNLFACLFVITFHVGERWERGMKKFYADHKKIVDVILIIGSLTIIVVILTLLKLITVPYAIGTLVVTIIGNFVWDFFKKKRRTE